MSDGSPIAVVLIGVSGSGKSTVGRQLASALDATFLEGDDYHPASNIAKMRAGTPLDDADRWPWLAKLGHAIAEQDREGRPVVVACSALRRTYREALAKAAGRPLRFVHLVVDRPGLDKRLGERAGHFMPRSLLGSQLAILEPLQEGENGTTIRAAGTVGQIVDAIWRWLRTDPHGE